MQLIVPFCCPSKWRVPLSKDYFRTWWTVFSGIYGGWLYNIRCVVTVTGWNPMKLAGFWWFWA